MRGGDLRQQKNFFFVSRAPVSGLPFQNVKRICFGNNWGAPVVNHLKIAPGESGERLQNAAATGLPYVGNNYRLEHRHSLGTDDTS